MAPPLSSLFLFWRRQEVGCTRAPHPGAHDTPCRCRCRCRVHEQTATRHTCKPPRPLAHHAPPPPPPARPVRSVTKLVLSNAWPACLCSASRHLLPHHRTTQSALVRARMPAPTRSLSFSLSCVLLLPDVPFRPPIVSSLLGARAPTAPRLLACLLADACGSPSPPPRPLCVGPAPAVAALVLPFQLTHTHATNPLLGAFFFALAPSRGCVARRQQGGPGSGGRLCGAASLLYPPLPATLISPRPAAP